MFADDVFLNPPKEFSVLPFWFWNDKLDADELVRQIDAFERNGVHGFVIHPRVGLPRDTGWMSDKLLGFYEVAIEEAARRGMRVILYDEGMYPSGSSCGQVVAKWPELACRCVARHDPQQPRPAGWNVIGSIDEAGQTREIVDRPVNAYIRGLHYIDEGPAEDEPPAGDILNPKTADAVIELVHERFHERFSKHFGQTILGIFTDEPNPLGKCREKGVLPGTAGIMAEVSRLLGYDFQPYLASLWSNDSAATRYRDDYRRAIRMRMEETWYRPLSEWCASKGIALCGHPDTGDEIGAQRFFQIPGQDLVWRFVAPDQPSAIEGAESTQGKCSSSAMVHAGRRRNSNEFAGAYGAETTFDEIRWLANWCLVRGVNMLIPHAFYYSVRGPRRDERPPQIGPHTAQWDSTFKAFADHCRRLSWLNTDSQHLCHTAILTHDDRCPWPAAAAVLRGQRDFNYIDPPTLLNDATATADGIFIGSMRYRVLVIDGAALLPLALQLQLQPMIVAGAVVRLSTARVEDGIESIREAEELIARIDKAAPAAIEIRCNSTSLRVRTVRKDGSDWAILFNESFSEPLSFELGSSQQWARVHSDVVDALAGEKRATFELRPTELIVFKNRSSV